MKGWTILKDLVTFKDFSRLMKVRHYTVDDLVSLFHGKIEDNRAFFTRVMECHFDVEKVVIPYRQVLKFYFEEKRAETIKKQGLA